MFGIQQRLFQGILAAAQFNLTASHYLSDVIQFRFGMGEVVQNDSSLRSA